MVVSDLHRSTSMFNTTFCTFELIVRSCLLLTVGQISCRSCGDDYRRRATESLDGKTIEPNQVSKQPPYLNCFPLNC
jgi:hypothetical protein